MERFTFYTLVLMIVLMIAYIVFMIVQAPKLDTDCFKEHATNYCENNNMTYDSFFGRTFECIKDHDLRKRKGTIERFYFLEEEWDSCIIKHDVNEVETAEVKE